MKNGDGPWWFPEKPTPTWLVVVLAVLVVLISIIGCTPGRGI